MTATPANTLRFEERAEQLVALANSEHLGVDDLAAGGDVGPWWEQLTGQHLALPTSRNAGLAKLHALRRLVHTCAVRNNPAIEEPDAPAEVSVLRVDLAADADGRITLVPSGTNDVVSTVSAALAESLLICAASRDWRRVRACAAPDCRWVFIDHSKNASRRWCDMGSCGTRAKVRSHRSRQAARSRATHR